jgi:23S rRNA pseudouridine1911/1915/1917 synthase
MKTVSIVVREDAVAPLDRWLATELARVLNRPVARALTRKAVRAGFVSAGGRLVRDPDAVLRRGPSVFVRSLEWLPAARTSGPSLRILFEDEWLIAVDKPAGLLTHESRDLNRPSLTAMVERHLGRRAFVHHRLDEGTSGVVLFATDAAANPGLARSFANRKVTKVYSALVKRPPVDWPDDLTLDAPLQVAKNGEVLTADGGVSSLTLIRILERGRQTLLVEARPVTGRKHQIRVHLAAAGAPILGDMRYGARSSGASRLMLHAERLELTHPVTGKPLAISSPRPRIFTTSEDSTLPPEADQARPKQLPHSRPRAVPRSSKQGHKETRQRRPLSKKARGSRR